MQRKNHILPAALLGLSLCLIVCGLLRGEGELVLSKAIRLCLECVGIG